MKKFFIAAVALLCLCGTAAAQRHIEFRWRGIYFVGDGSYMMNLNRSPNEEGRADSVSGFMASFSGGFQFRKEAAVGLGFAYMADPTGAFTQLPLYVELRSHFTRDRCTPYAVLQVGYSLPVGASSEPPVTKIDEGGLYLAVEGGARFAISRSFALGIHAGYRLLQSNKVIRYDLLNEPNLTESVVLHMIGGGLSLYFGN